MASLPERKTCGAEIVPARIEAFVLGDDRGRQGAVEGGAVEEVCVAVLPAPVLALVAPEVYIAAMGESPDARLGVEEEAVENAELPVKSAAVEACILEYAVLVDAEMDAEEMEGDARAGFLEMESLEMSTLSECVLVAGVTTTEFAGRTTASSVE